MRGTAPRLSTVRMANVVRAPVLVSVPATMFVCVYLSCALSAVSAAPGCSGPGQWLHADLLHLRGPDES